jgi:hypothetical protein
MGPTTLTSGTLQISDTLVYAASNTTSAITQSAGSVLTLNNSQTLIPDLTNVARNTFGGFYSILHSVYDKTNSTFVGTSLSAIDYSQHVNVDKLIVGNTTVNVAITSTAITSNATLAAGNTTITGSANVSTTFQVGANVVLGTTTISANGGVGSAGQVLTSGSTGNVYWSTVATTLDAVLGIGNTTTKSLTTGTLTVNGAIKTTGVFFENATAVTADYSISANSNAMTAGPISIANSATVTIPSDSNWIIL